MSDQPGLALGISASGPLSCALLSEGRLHTRCALPGERSAGKIAAYVAELLAEASTSPRHVRELRIDIGPGSYTGLRAAIAFAQMIAAFGNASLLTATSAELVAIAASDADLIKANADLLVIRDGTRNLVLRTKIRITDHARIIAAPQAEPLDDIIQELHPGQCLLLDQKLHSTLRSQFSGQCEQMVAAPRYGAAQLFSKRLRLRASTPQELEPLYLMASYAE